MKNEPNQSDFCHKADFVPFREDLATATRASAKAIPPKPDRRCASETELHPPFNMSDWGGEKLRQDVRWQFGVPPKSDADFACVQYFIHNLAPQGIVRLRPRKRQKHARFTQPAELYYK
jgi:hypothetical protein